MPAFTIRISIAQPVDGDQFSFLAWFLELTRKLNFRTMRSLITVVLIVIIAGLSSCIEENVGPRGPEGPEGPQGPPGESGFVFEYEDVDFTSPDYEVILPYPDDFESFASDVALVYLLWDVVEIDGVDTEVWRQLPQSLFLQQGTLRYNFDFTTADVRLFMEADFDKSSLGAIDTDDWIVRVVIVPGEFWNSSRLAAGEIPYDQLEEMLGLPELPTPNPEIIRRK